MPYSSFWEHKVHVLEHIDKKLREEQKDADLFSFMDRGLSLRKNSAEDELGILLDDRKEAKDSSEEEKLSEEMDYPFLFENMEDLVSDFSSLYPVLKKQRRKNKKLNEAEKMLWAYNYYLAATLKTYFDEYQQQPKKIKEYADILEEIKRSFSDIPVIMPAVPAVFIAPSFLDVFELQLNAFVESVKGLLKSLAHPSEMRSNTQTANLIRLNYTFNRLWLTISFAWAEKNHYTGLLDSILGTRTDVKKILEIFKETSRWTNYFSVGFFLFCFLVDGFMLLKHVLTPQAGATPWQIFLFELSKRDLDFINNGVWTLINGLTNFIQKSGLSPAAAGNLTALFLLFDASLIFYQRRREQRKYEYIKTELLREIEKFEQYGIDPATVDPKSLVILNKLDLFRKQLAEHELSWQVKDEKFKFKMAAALLLTVSFTMSMVFTPPLMVAVCYMACTVAIGMYWTSGDYATYREKSLRLESCEEKKESMAFKKAEKEVSLAFNKFIFSLVVEQTIMPMLFISTLLVCPAACLALGALYLGYQSYRNYDRFVESKKMEWEVATALPAP